MFRAKLWGCLGAALGLVRGWAGAGQLLRRGWGSSCLAPCSIFRRKIVLFSVFAVYLQRFRGEIRERVRKRIGI